MVKNENELTKIRESVGLNKKDFAEMIGVTPSIITYIEQGKKLLTPKIKRAIEKTFGMQLLTADEATQAERFRWMREDLLNMTQTQLSEKLNRASYKIIADIESGRKQRIDTDILKILKNKYGININWLLFGEGYVTEFDECENRQTNFNHIIAIPFYNVTAAAGMGQESIQDAEENFMHFDVRWLKNILKVNNPNTLSIIYAKGDSMDSGLGKSDDIKDGDMLLVDNSNKSGNGGIFVIKQNENVLRVKRLSRDFNGNILILSNNPKYKAEIVYNSAKSLTIEIVGKVVWNGSKENV